MNNILKNKKGLALSSSKGSSLIIAILLIGVVSVVSFGVSSLTMNDIKLHRLFVGSGESYYGAESALEEALLEVKNDRGYSTVITGEVNSLINNTSGVDVEAKYTATYYGDYFHIEKIEKDDFVDVLLGDEYNTGDKLCIAYENGNFNNIQIIENFGSVDGSYRSLNIPNIIEPISNPTEYIISHNKPISIRISLVGLEVNNLYTISVEDSFDCGEIDLNNLDASVDGISNNINIDTGSLTIKSTGTYKKLNRQLQATIDRKSGALLNIFDFTLYSIGDIK